MLIIMTLTYHWSIFLFDSIDLRRENYMFLGKISVIAMKVQQAATSEQGLED